eukprot:403349405
MEKLAKAINIHQICAHFIKNSQNLLITSGAGMGVDSGLPDFRGPNGFYKAYPYFKQVGMKFEDAASPSFFKQDPKKYWYFYGHRFKTYQDTIPNEGFTRLLEWSQKCLQKSDKKDATNHFVFTSNVDGQFQKAGFSDQNVVEAHGTIHKFQCDKCDIIEDRRTEQIELDTVKYEAVNIPKCLKCDQLVRPNILMFGDYSWLSYDVDQKVSNYMKWLNQITNESLVIIEVGAGSAVPTVRMQNEMVLQQRINKNTVLIRINPSELQYFNVKKDTITLTQ